MGMDMVTVVVIGSMAIVFGVLLGGQILRTRKQRRLLAAGEAAQAVILEIKQAGGGGEYAPGFSFLLEVHPIDRPAYRARAEATVRLENLPRFQPGAVVQVKFDPRDPTQVAIM